MAENKQLKKDTADAVKIIADAVSAATKLTTDQAASAVKVIADAAAEAVKVHTIANGVDHDLIVGLVKDVGNLTKKVDEISARDDKFTLKEDFVFWRNLLVGGLSTTVITLIGIIIKLLGN